MTSPNHELPRLAVKAGAVEGQPERTGIVYCLEHTLANRGTTQLSTTNFSADAPHLDTIRSLYDRPGSGSPLPVC